MMPPTTQQTQDQTATTNSHKPILEIRNLTIDYGYGDDRVRALHDVSLTLREGEILGLAGESGCGKSTLVYGATRLLPPPGLICGGEVLYYPANGGAPVDILRQSDTDLRSSRWQETAIVFQGAMNSLNPVYRVGTQLTDVIAAHRPGTTKAEREERARELLSMVSIAPDRVRAYPHQLSGGMRQRVMIAMALALEPRLLIMDEPTTALDVVVQKQIVKQINELKQQLGFSVIFITHDLSLLIEIADRIAIMYAGQIVEQGPASQLHKQPRHPYTMALLNSFPPLHGPRRVVTGIPGTPPDLTQLPPGCTFHPRCPYEMPRCSSQIPSLIEPTAAGREPDRLVACWLDEDSGVTPPPELAIRTQ